MKTRWLICALLTAIIASVAAVLFKENAVLLAVGVFIVTCAGVLSLYFILKGPIENMRHQVMEVEEENRQAENIRSEFSGFIETLQAGAVNDPETRDRFIEIIAIETARLKRLIDDILVLSDIESRMDTSDENINVFVITDDVAEMLEPIAHRRNITVINEIDDTLEIKGSEDKFRQMMVNLIENAIKYGKDGGHVWVRGYETDDEKIITVKDDGIGIEQKDLERIAERFYRVDKSRSTKVGGTGLGLSIVKHTAALFNGELKVSSKPDEGSEFSIVIKK